MESCDSYCFTNGEHGLSEYGSILTKAICKGYLQTKGIMSKLEKKVINTVRQNFLPSISLVEKQGHMHDTSCSPSGSKSRK